MEEVLADENSVFNYYRKLISIRKSNPVFMDGIYKEYLEDSEKVFCFTRTNNTKEILVLLSFSKDYEKVELPEKFHMEGAKVLISNYSAQAESVITLPPYGSVVFIRDK